MLDKAQQASIYITALPFNTSAEVESFVGFATVKDFGLEGIVLLIGANPPTLAY